MNDCPHGGASRRGARNRSTGVAVVIIGVFLLLSPWRARAVTATPCTPCTSNSAALLGAGKGATVVAKPGDRPTLVVMIVVDQLGEALIERYDSLYTGGFRRLLDQGRIYRRATHDHAATKTAVGHATLSTGTYPSRHGVVANEWYERVGGRWVQVSNVGDSSVRIVGQPGLTGVSPHYLLRTGLADWMVAANPRSQVASVSGKDRGAVLPAAHVRGQVYWFESKVGRFVTSTYFRTRYPAWVARFDDDVIPKYRADSVWRSTIPAGERERTDPDTNGAEGDGIHSYFPHRFALEGRTNAFWDWFETTPALDSLTLDFAQDMVRSLALGRDRAPDLLNISLSATDRVGHAYSPSSREQLDNLLRLDRELGTFFTFLDRTVGRGRWVVALSADHGAPDSPEDRVSHGEYGHRASKAEYATLDSIRADADRHEDDSTMSMRVVAALKRLPFVADAWTDESLRQDTPRDSFAVLQSRSVYPGRAGGEFSREGVEVRFVDGFLERPRGIDHGSPYWHDRHVPLIFMGAHITRGCNESAVATVDFAPTLAQLLGIAYPNDLDGRPLEGLVRRWCGPS